MKKVTINELQPGMKLARTIINENMIVVLAENTQLTAAHIHRLEALGVREVQIKDDYDLSPQNFLVQAMISRSHAFVAEYYDVLATAEKIFKTTARTKELPIDPIKNLIADSISPMIKESGIIDYIYELKHINNSVYNHSLRVSILSGVLAKWMNFSKAETQDVILAGLLHDIGKTQMDEALAEKNIEELTENEYEIYIQHTLTGYEMLKDKNDIADGIKRAALQHHEKNNGSGFPFNSSADDIHLYAKIISVTDLYDNITTEREGFLKQTPFSAIAQIAKEMFTTLDPKICVPFIINVQQSFIGSQVLLSDKQKGKIIQYTKDFYALPVICTESKEIIDLNTRPELSIIEYNPA